MGKKKKWLIAGAVILFILSACYIFVSVFVPNFSYKEYDETNTFEFTATVKSIEEDKKEYKIFMNEYSACLLIKPYQLLSVDSLSALQENDAIVFRVLAKELVESPLVDEIYVVSLKSSSEEFITLESSTKILQHEIRNGKIIGITASVLMFGGAVCMLCFALFKKKKTAA